MLTLTSLLAIFVFLKQLLQHRPTWLLTWLLVLDRVTDRCVRKVFYIKLAYCAGGSICDYSRVKNLTFMTTFWVRCFDD